jgi:hypothetical protein
MRPITYFVCAAFSAGLYAQESQLGADFRGEGDRLKESCSGFSFGKVASCAQVLFTDHPMHIAVGSLAPQNGFAFGPAFTSHWTPNETWRLNFDMDAVAATSGSWRAGAYMTAILVRRPKIGVAMGTSKSGKVSDLAVEEYPVFHVYAQSISLTKLAYFGLGPDTKDTARSYFGMRETIIGTNVVWPLPALKKLNASVFGEMNGRFVDLRASTGHSSPSIEQLYTEATAPGLTRQPGTAQFGEGIRVRPTLAGDYIRLNYSLTYQQYVASNSVFSFQRLTTDLSHQFPIYKKTRSLLPKDTNGPDDCSGDNVSQGGDRKDKFKCPGVTRDLQGSFGFRFLLSESLIPSGNIVPFYFQQTLGGSDVNGQPALSSYQDYRFRAPNLMLIRGSFEHSLPGKFSPLGVAFAADAGKVALRHSDLDSAPFRHSYSAGLTLRAGGFPQIFLLYAWGGNEGTHTIGSINTSLLGGSFRPSLY